MNPVAAQQVALDNALVTHEKQLKIKKCNICPRLPNQDFVEPPSKENMVLIIKLGYTRKCDMLSEIHTDHIHSPREHLLLSSIEEEPIKKPKRANKPAKKSTIVPTAGVVIRDTPGVSVSKKKAPAKVDKGKGMDLLSNVVLIKAAQPMKALKKSKQDTHMLYAGGSNLHTICYKLVGLQDLSCLCYWQATPKKARKFKKITLPSKKLSFVLEEEPIKKPKRANKPAKKSTILPTAGVVIRDTPGVSVSKKKAPAKVDKGKGMDLLSNVALIKAAQPMKALKKSKQDTHMLYASGSGNGGNSKDDDSNDDNSDDVTNDDDDDDVDSNADGDNETCDSEKTDSDEDKNPNLNQNDDDEEEYVRTPKNYEFYDDDDEYEELYKDVNVRLKDAKHEEEGKRDSDIIDAGCDDVS
nr:hypothetical protein [Tanacetum cinerariifolium]